MKIVYESDIDVLTVTFRAADVVESDELTAGVIVDYDDQGNVVSLEILDASTRVDQPGEIIYAAQRSTHTAA